MQSSCQPISEACTCILQVINCCLSTNSVFPFILLTTLRCACDKNTWGRESCSKNFLCSCWLDMLVCPPFTVPVSPLPNRGLLRKHLLLLLKKKKKSIMHGSKRKTQMWYAAHYLALQSEWKFKKTRTQVHLTFYIYSTDYCTSDIHNASECKYSNNNADKHLAVAKVYTWLHPLDLWHSCQLNKNCGCTCQST